MKSHNNVLAQSVIKCFPYLHAAPVWLCAIVGGACDVHSSAQHRVNATPVGRILRYNSELDIGTVYTTLVSYYGEKNMKFINLPTYLDAAVEASQAIEDFVNTYGFNHEETAEKAGQDLLSTLDRPFSVSEREYARKLAEVSTIAAVKEYIDTLGDK